MVKKHIDPVTDQALIEAIINPIYLDSFRYVLDRYYLKDEIKLIINLLWLVQNDNEG